MQCVCMYVSGIHVKALHNKPNPSPPTKPPPPRPPLSLSSSSHLLYPRQSPSPPHRTRRTGPAQHITAQHSTSSSSCLPRPRRLSCWSRSPQRTGLEASLPLANLFTLPCLLPIQLGTAREGLAEEIKAFLDKIGQRGGGRLRADLRGWACCGSAVGDVVGTRSLS